MTRSEDAAAPAATPAAEVAVDAELVRRLLAEQHPDLAALPLAPVDAGWDNAMFRLGPDLAVRLPRRAVAALPIRHEQRWLSRLAPTLPLAVPAPVRVGRPGPGYPWHWSVVPWLAGTPADLDAPAASQAAPLAGFLRALHVQPADTAPANAFRGVPLAARAAVVEARLARLGATTSVVKQEVLAAWAQGLTAPVGADPCWLHGDLHARNVLVEHGVIAAIIDWGDLCAGDRATDLAAVWMLLDAPGARSRAIAAYGDVQPGTWQRARAWAVSFGAVLLETGLSDHPRHAAMGRDILRRVVEGPAAADLP